jgi:hypothetical protein
MNSAGFWRFATISTIGVCAVVFAAIVQLGLVSSATSIQGNNLTAVKVVRDAGTVSTNSQEYVNVPGASTMITVPAGKQALIIVRFGAASMCQQTPPTGVFCKVRVLVGGAEASPTGDSADYWDSLGASEGSVTSHTIERSILKGPGTHTVRIQYRVGDPSSSFSLLGFHMTVERIIR